MSRTSIGKKESVWDYPRPPRMEDSPRLIQVEFGGVVIAKTNHAKRILETSHPPVYYIPPEDVLLEFLIPESLQTFCEWKGAAKYYAIRVRERQQPRAAWYYPFPSSPYQALRNFIAFYPAKMDRCLIDGEVVQPQPGDFYGGWITADVVGPFKGYPSSSNW